jgi:hypothetical protein
MQGLQVTFKKERQDGEKEMNKRLKLLLKRLYRSQRGQAMTSYAIVAAALLVGLAFSSLVFMPELLDSINAFSESIYFGINMPFP